MKLLNVYHQGNIIHSEILADETTAQTIFEEKTSHLDNYNRQICMLTLTDLHPDFIEELRLKEEHSEEEE